MARTVVVQTIDTKNHQRQDYTVKNIFLAYPSKQKSLTFINGTASERTILAGTLVGVLASDPTVADSVQSDGTSGTEVPFGILLDDLVIPAGASEELDALVGWNGIVYADCIVLEKSGDTLETPITGSTSIVLGLTIKNALLSSNSLLQIEDAATNISGYKDAQV